MFWELKKIGCECSKMSCNRCGNVGIKIRQDSEELNKYKVKIKSTYLFIQL